MTDKEDKLTLEKLDIHNRLKTVESKIDDQGQILQDIKHCVLGTTTTIGLMERLRGLENLAIQVRGLAVVVFGVVVKAIIDWWHK